LPNNQTTPQSATSSTAASAATQSQSRLMMTRFGSMPLNLNYLTSLFSKQNPISSNIQLSEDKLAIEIENGSIYLLRQFISRSIEILGLWKILEEHKYHFIATKLDQTMQESLLRMKIYDFLMCDNTTLDQLITALLYKYIDDNACTDMLNQSLKLMCPSLYTNENAIFSKACEKLKQALSIKNDMYEREMLLKEAVDLMKQIGYVANLEQVCDMLHAAGCYEAIFELGLQAAEKRDPQNIALFYYKKFKPSEDLQGQHFFQLRLECYKCLTDCLTNLLTKTPTNTLNSKEKLEETLNHLIHYVILKSKDELAHYSLFNWMVDMGMEKRLVSVDSPFLESYLVREIKEEEQLGKTGVASVRSGRVYLDLLWRHYDYRKDYLNAAKVLTALAEKYSPSQVNNDENERRQNRITLKERVEYLTQAIVSLNSSNNNKSSSVKDEINELNDKKDVALLQEKIYEQLARIAQQDTTYRHNDGLIQDALLQLDSQLYDITKLYYEFAEKFDLHQSQLAILKVSRHDDPKTVEILWKQIIANGYLKK
jgi:nuclear pore complex protein Nup155